MLGGAPGRGALVRSPREMWHLLNRRLDLITAHLEDLKSDSRIDQTNNLIVDLNARVAALEAQLAEAAMRSRHDIDLLRAEAIAPMHRAIGRVEARQLTSAPFEESGFQVSSQDGEDGLLWRLAQCVPRDRRVFVEFGVEDYQEANTRFLLTDGRWSGLVLDADEENVERIRSSSLYWQYNLQAEQAWVTRENVNAVLAEHEMTGEIGCLSIDIDGNDWWVWDAIDVVNPIVISVEFNWRFGPTRAVTVPYDETFDRRIAHPSWLYFGASLKALEMLGARKGYALVGVSASAVNAFFVRSDRLTAQLPARHAEDLWLPGRYSECRDSEGNLTKLSSADQMSLVASLPLEEVA